MVSVHDALTPVNTGMNCVIGILASNPVPQLQNLPWEKSFWISVQLACRDLALGNSRCFALSTVIFCFTKIKLAGYLYGTMLNEMLRINGSCSKFRKMLARADMSTWLRLTTRLSEIMHPRIRCTGPC